MKAIYRKELGQMFRTVIGYVYLAVFAVIGGLYFTIYNLLQANGDIRSFYSPMMSTVIFLIPILTMRSYSEERKMKTDRLLMSSPVSSFSVAMGKFLAQLTVFAIGLSFTLIYVLILASLGSFDGLVVAGNLIGMLVAAAAFIAIGMFISSLTENQITACIISYAVMLALWMIGTAQSYISNEFLSDLADWLSLANRFAEFSMGILDLSTLVYYLSITAFFLLTVVIYSEKQRLASPEYRRKSALVIGLALAVFVSGNIFSEKISEKLSLRLDLTSSRLYELSEVTEDVLDGLESDVDIVVFSAEKDYPAMISEILERYKKAGENHIKLRYVDPYENPIEVDGYIQKGLEIELNTIVVEGGYYSRAIDLEDMFVLSQDGGSIEGLSCEQLLTGAVIYASGADAPEVAFTAGHNETVTESLSNLFEVSNYDTGYITLSLADIPEDVGLLVISGPTADFTDAEISKLDGFMARGGRILVFLEPTSNSLANLEEFLAEWGVGVSDIVVAEKAQFTDANPLSLVPVFASHDINRYFSANQIFLVMPSTLALEQKFVSRGGIKTQKLLYSTDKAYAADGTESGLTAPYALAMTCEKKLDGESKARMVVIGSRGICSDSLMQSSSNANAAFAAQVINWCVEKESTVSIPAVSLSNSSISVTAGTVRLIAVLIAGLLPAVIIAAGTGVYLKRKRL